MNITLTGNLGSGKSSVCKELKAMGFDIISGGDIFRGLAREKGISVIEMNELAKKDRSIDDMIDARSTRLGDELDRTVFDSRLAWHFVRKSFKVFLLVDTDEAARRVFEGENRQSEEYQTLDQAAEGLSARAGMERERFRNLYGIDYYRSDNYDLVIESTNADPHEIALEIVRNFEEYQKSGFTGRLELNLKNIYPADGESCRRMVEAALCASGNCGSLGDVGSPVPVSGSCRNPKMLCAGEKLKVSFEGGYNLTKDADLVKMIREGVVFTEVEMVSADPAVGPLKASDYARIEEAGGFAYRRYPDTKIDKHEYMMKF